MALNRERLVLEIQSDTAAGQKGLDDVSQSISKLEKNVASSSRETKRLNDSFDEISQSSMKTAEQIGEIESNYSRLARQVEQTEIGKLTEQVSKLADEQERLSKSIKEDIGPSKSAKTEAIEKMMDSVQQNQRNVSYSTKILASDIDRQTSSMNEMVNDSRGAINSYNRIHNAVMDVISVYAWFVDPNNIAKLSTFFSISSQAMSEAGFKKTGEAVDALSGKVQGFASTIQDFNQRALDSQKSGWEKLGDKIRSIISIYDRLSVTIFNLIGLYQFFTNPETLSKIAVFMKLFATVLDVKGFDRIAHAVERAAGGVLIFSEKMQEVNDKAGDALQSTIFKLKMLRIAFSSAGLIGAAAFGLLTYAVGSAFYGAVKGVFGFIQQSGGTFSYFKTIGTEIITSGSRIRAVWSGVVDSLSSMSKILRVGITSDMRTILSMAGNLRKYVSLFSGEIGAMILGTGKEIVSAFGSLGKMAADGLIKPILSIPSKFAVMFASAARQASAGAAAVGPFKQALLSVQWQFEKVIGWSKAAGREFRAGFKLQSALDAIFNRMAQSSGDQFGIDFLSRFSRAVNTGMGHVFASWRVPADAFEGISKGAAASSNAIIRALTAGGSAISTAFGAIWNTFTTLATLPIKIAPTFVKSFVFAGKMGVDAFTKTIAMTHAGSIWSAMGLNSNEVSRIIKEYRGVLTNMKGISQQEISKFLDLKSIVKRIATIKGEVNLAAMFKDAPSDVLDVMARFDRVVVDGIRNTMYRVQSMGPQMRAALSGFISIKFFAAEIASSMSKLGSMIMREMSSDRILSATVVPFVQAFGRINSAISNFSTNYRTILKSIIVLTADALIFAKTGYIGIVSGAFATLTLEGQAILRNVSGISEQIAISIGKSLGSIPVLPAISEVVSRLFKGIMSQVNSVVGAISARWELFTRANFGNTVDLIRSSKALWNNLVSMASVSMQTIGSFFYSFSNGVIADFSKMFTKFVGGIQLIRFAWYSNISWVKWMRDYSSFTEAFFKTLFANGKYLRDFVTSSFALFVPGTATLFKLYVLIKNVSKGVFDFAKAFASLQVLIFKGFAGNLISVFSALGRSIFEFGRTFLGIGSIVSKVRSAFSGVRSEVLLLSAPSVGAAGVGSFKQFFLDIQYRAEETAAYLRKFAAALPANFRSMVAGVWMTVAPFAKAVASFVSPIGTAIMNGAAQAADFLSPIAVRSWQVFTSVASNAVKAAKDIGDSFMAGAQTATTALGKIGAGSFAAIGTMLGKLGGVFKPIGDTWAANSDQLKAIGKSMLDTIRALWQSIVSMVSNISTVVSVVFKSGLSNLPSAMSSVFPTLSKTAGAFLQGLVDGFAHPFQTIGNVVKSAMEVVKTTVTGAARACVPSFFSMVEAGGSLGPILFGLGTLARQSDSAFVRFLGTLGMITAVLMSGFSVAVVYAANVIGGLVTSIGVKLMSAMDEWEQKSIELAAVMNQFKFAISSFSRNLGEEAVGSLELWMGEVDKINATSQFAVKEIVKSIKMLISEGSALGLDLGQNMKLLSASVDIAANSGRELTDVTMGLMSALAGNSQAALALAIDTRNNALANTTFMKSQQKFVEQLSEHEAVQARLDAILERGANLRGAAENQTKTLAGAHAMLAKTLDNVKQKLGEQGSLYLLLTNTMTGAARAILSLPESLLRVIGVMTDWVSVSLVVIGTFIKYMILMMSLHSLWSILTTKILANATVQKFLTWVMQGVAKALKVQLVLVNASAVSMANLGRIIWGTVIASFRAFWAIIVMVSKGLWAMTVALLSNPLFWKIGFIVAGLAVFVSALREMWSELRAAGGAFDQTGKDSVKFAEDAAAMRTVFDDISSVIGGSWNAVKSYVKMMMTTWLLAVYELIKGYKYLKNGIASVWNSGSLKTPDTEEFKKDIDELNKKINALGNYAVENGEKVVSSFSFGTAQAATMGKGVKQTIRELHDLRAALLSIRDASAKAFNKSDMQVQILGDEFDKASNNIISSARKVSDSYLAIYDAKKNMHTKPENAIPVKTPGEEKNPMYLRAKKAADDLRRLQEAEKRGNGEVTKEMLDAAVKANEEYTKAYLEAQKIVKDENKKAFEQYQQMQLQKLKDEGKVADAIRLEADMQIAKIDETIRGVQRLNAETGNNQSVANLVKLRKAIIDSVEPAIRREAEKSRQEKIKEAEDQYKKLGEDARKTQTELEKIGKTRLQQVEMDRKAAIKEIEILEQQMIALGMLDEALGDIALKRKQGFDEAKKMVNLKAKAQGDEITGGAGKFLTTVIDKTESAGLAMKAAAGPMNATVGAVGEVIDIAQGIVDLIPGIIDKAAKLVGSITDFPKTVTTSAMNLMKEVTRFAGDFLPGIFNIAAKHIPESLEESMKKTPEALLKMVSEGLPKAIEGFIDKIPSMAYIFVSGLLTGIVKIASMFPALFIKTIPKIWIALFKMIPMLGRELARGFMDGIRGAGGSLSDLFKMGSESAVTQAGNFIRKLAKNTATATSQIFRFEDLASAANRRKSGSQLLADMAKASRSFGDQIKKAGQYILDRWRAFWDWLVKIWRGLWDGIVGFWRGLVGIFEELGKRMFQAFQDAWNDAAEILSELGTKVFLFFKQCWDNAAKDLSSLGTRLFNAFKDGWDGSAAGFAILGAKVFEAFRAGWDASVEVLKMLGKDVFGKFQEAWNASIEDAKRFGGWIWDGAKLAFENARSVITNFGSWIFEGWKIVAIDQEFSKLGGWIFNGLKTPLDGAGDLFRSCGGWLADGLRIWMETLTDTFKRAGGWISDGFRDAFAALFFLADAFGMMIASSLGRWADLAFDAMNRLGSWISGAIRWPEFSTPPWLSSLSSTMNNLHSWPNWLQPFKDAVDKLSSVNLGGGGGGGGGWNPIQQIESWTSGGGAKGGMIRAAYAASGAFISWHPKGIDTVPIMGAEGEGIISRRGMAVLGVSGLNALNQGISPMSGDQNIEINLTINTREGEKIDENFVRTRLVPSVIRELRRESEDGKRILSPKGVR